MKPINNEELAYLQEKYGKLVYKAARAITGDLARDEEDYAQEIWYVILDYLPKYVKKHNKASVQEFCQDPKFNGYIKQWIWTAKNHIGQLNTDRKAINSASIRLDRGSSEDEYDISLELQESNEEMIPLILAEIKESPELKNRVLSSVAFDTDTIKDNGHFNATQISKHLGISYGSVRHQLDKIREEFKNATKDL
jgi:hypothetical protein